MAKKSKRALPRGIFRNPSSRGLKYGIQWIENKNRYRILVSDSLAEAVRYRKDIKAVIRARKLGMPPQALGSSTIEHATESDTVIATGVPLLSGCLCFEKA